ncbi:MAG: family 20 glycosylhydrolase, partial [Candidatus Aminicenantes bacterium]|nr:family 20 glycosylhydrolase [Candidatus Aminicenantes bacterium]
MTNFFKPFFFKAKNLLIFSFGLTILITCTSCTPQLSPEFSQMGPQIPVIPAPAFVQNKPGKFRIIPGFRILSTQKDMEARKIINSFAEKLRQINGLDVPIIAGSEIEFRDNMMVIELAAEKSHLGNEGYELEIDPNSMSIQAYKPAGLFYGVQTLLQLLPPELETGQNLPGFNQMTLPCMKIIDTPRFPYRGMHLDVGRHFFPVSFIKKYIDLLALHKFNTFHWHLTEDQGWRIEIKKYPGLSDISSTRNETLVGHYRDQPHKYDGQPHGGVYTQQEIRDVVQYALDRFITIIPEIEMPGHSVAALAAYPELSCTGGSFDVSTIWGVKEDVY